MGAFFYRGFSILYNMDNNEEEVTLPKPISDGGLTTLGDDLDLTTLVNNGLDQTPT